MAAPDSALGIAYQFDADKFRRAIRFVFEMETATAAQAIVFHFTDTVAFAGPADGDIVPFDPTEVVTRTTPTPVSVPCDVEFIQSTEVATAFGVVIPARLRVTLLDVDWVIVKDSTFVTVGTERYLRDYEQPASALFDVDLHIITFVAENER